MSSERDDVPVFIGDEVTAAGYRLAGARVLTPALEQTARCFDEVAQSGALILITAEHATQLPPKTLESAADRGLLVAIVPDARRRVELPDLAARLRRELGIET
jgi:vacuolar-type H+-ATPase subunit F/Vma7